MPSLSRIKHIATASSTNTDKQEESPIKTGLTQTGRKQKQNPEDKNVSVQASKEKGGPPANVKLARGEKLTMEEVEKTVEEVEKTVKRLEELADKGNDDKIVAEMKTELAKVLDIPANKMNEYLKALLGDNDYENTIFAVAILEAILEIIKTIVDINNSTIKLPIYGEYADLGDAVRATGANISILRDPSVDKPTFATGDGEFELHGSEAIKRYLGIFAKKETL